MAKTESSRFPSLRKILAIGTLATIPFAMGGDRPRHFDGRQDVLNKLLQPLTPREDKFGFEIEVERQKKEASEFVKKALRFLGDGDFRRTDFLSHKLRRYKSSVQKEFTEGVEARLRNPNAPMEEKVRALCLLEELGELPKLKNYVSQFRSENLKEASGETLGVLIYVCQSNLKGTELQSVYDKVRPYREKALNELAFSESSSYGESRERPYDYTDKLQGYVLAEMGRDPKFASEVQDLVARTVSSQKRNERDLDIVKGVLSYTWESLKKNELALFQAMAKQTVQNICASHRVDSESLQLLNYAFRVEDVSTDRHMQIIMRDFLFSAYKKGEFEWREVGSFSSLPGVLGLFLRSSPAGEELIRSIIECADGTYDFKAYNAIQDEHTFEVFYFMRSKMPEALEGIALEAIKHRDKASGFTDSWRTAELIEFYLSRKGIEPLLSTLLYDDSEVGRLVIAMSDSRFNEDKNKDKNIRAVLKFIETHEDELKKKGDERFETYAEQMLNTNSFGLHPSTVSKLWSFLQNHRSFLNNPAFTRLLPYTFDEGHGDELDTYIEQNWGADNHKAAEALLESRLRVGWDEKNSRARRFVKSKEKDPSMEEFLEKNTYLAEDIFPERKHKNAMLDVVETMERGTVSFGLVKALSGLSPEKQRGFFLHLLQTIEPGDAFNFGQNLIFSDTFDDISMKVDPILLESPVRSISMFAALRILRDDPTNRPAAQIVTNEITQKDSPYAMAAIAMGASVGVPESLGRIQKLRESGSPEEQAGVLQSLNVSISRRSKRMIEGMKYAATALNDQKTMNYVRLVEKAVALGFDNPFRFTTFELTEIIRNRTNPDKRDPRPLLTMIVPKSDWNGVFNIAQRQRKSLFLKYQAMVYEADTDTAVIQRSQEAARKTGKKISVLSWGGHGNRTLLSLSAEDPRQTKILEKSRAIDAGDAKQLRDGLRGIVSDRLKVLLDSCSVGEPAAQGDHDKNLTESIYAALHPIARHCEVYGPNRPIRGDEIIFTYKRNGLLRDMGPKNIVLRVGPDN